jgi:hypothetical protein
VEKFSFVHPSFRLCLLLLHRLLQRGVIRLLHKKVKVNDVVDDSSSHHHISGAALECAFFPREFRLFKKNYIHFQFIALQK